MRRFCDINPIVVFIYFIIVSCFPVFIENGVLYLISFFCALAYFTFKNGKKEIQTHIFCLLAFLILSTINPIVSHNGKTVLFVVNNSPITLEAVIYGVYSAFLVVSVFYWFKIFSQIMSVDKILFIFDRFSHKLALIISMGLRYIPLLKLQIKKINQGLIILGEYKNDNFFNRFRLGIKTFSMVVTWILENGIISAESMDSRGYGVSKRTSFCNYKILFSDFVFLILSLLLLFLSIILLQNVNFQFYPEFKIQTTEISFWGYFLYFILAILPILIDLKEKLKWKYLERKI